MSQVCETQTQHGENANIADMQFLQTNKLLIKRMYSELIINQVFLIPQLFISNN